MCSDFEMSDASITTASPTHARSNASSNRKKKTKASRGPITPKLPRFEDHEEKADFMINVFKVKLCTRRRRHTWSGCPYAHPGETAKRRDPHTHHAVPCPEMKQGNRCPRGDQCPYSHHDFEYWLHPARYCTVMCNKGANCDRSLCFFAHHPQELRSHSASGLPDVPTSTLLDTRMHETPSDGHESSSSSDIILDKCVEDMKSSASLTSVADSFKSTYDRFQGSLHSRDVLHNVESSNECSPSLFLKNNLPNFQVPAESHPRKPRQTPSVTVKPQATSDFCASADICQLLRQPHGPAVNDPQLPADLLLQKSLPVGQTPNLSPTCHFSGLSGEFVRSNGLQTLPTRPAAFDLLDMNSAKSTSHGLQGTMPTTNSALIVPPPFPTQTDPFAPTQLTSMAPVTSHSFNQAMDSLPSLSQNELLSQAAALQSLASSSSMLGGSPNQALLRDVEILQLLKLQLLCNMQGGMQATPSFASAAPPFDPTCPSPGLTRDQLYSLQQQTGRFSSQVSSTGLFP